MRPNLVFAGNAGDVLAFYRSSLGGEAEIVRYAGSPVADGVPAEWGDKILYARLRTPWGEIDLMDAPPGNDVTTGGNIAIAVDIDDDDRAARVFANLAEEGNVIMPFAEAFFARRFGMTNDKFGVRWMISVAPMPLAAI